MLDNMAPDSITVPFGEHSMNLLAPFWPQTSGALHWTGVYLLTRGSIGATNGQYGGYRYLGLGALLLVAVAAVRSGRAMPDLLRRNWALALALFVLTAWAVSNRICLGPMLIASHPLPNWLLSTGWRGFVPAGGCSGRLPGSSRHLASPATLAARTRYDQPTKRRSGSQRPPVGSTRYAAGVDHSPPAAANSGRTTLRLLQALYHATSTFGEVPVHEPEGPNKMVTLAIIGPHFRTEAAVCRIRQRDRSRRVGHREI
jgi:hypothetical protein